MAEQRILLIEDEPTTREILTELLRLEGYAIDSVATAGAAATCLQTIPYALVIADWVLPDGDGIDVADSAAHFGAHTLVVTGYISNLPEGVAERHPTLSKPVDHHGGLEHRSRRNRRAKSIGLHATIAGSATRRRCRASRCAPTGSFIAHLPFGSNT